ncbi:MAG: hypothetical protein M1812_001050 [Candelaria pacifica]|nr:MAG: hypothetical protein M1812_001050 [Candelaria pacifica]
MIARQESKLKIDDQRLKVALECQTLVDQCDLTRPSCMRCARRQVTCPGYRNEVDVIFRNENLSTLAARAGRDRCNKSPSTTGVSTAMVVPQPLRSSSTAEAEELPLILDHFSSSPGWQRGDGSIGFLTRMVQQSAEDSAIVYSCRAAARACLSNRQRTTNNRSREVDTYGKALAATNAVLQDRKACSSDDTALASVWLLGLHEVIAGAANSRKYPAPITWAIHTKGLLSLLRLRISGMLETRPGRDLFWLVNRSIQTHCFVAEVECPSDTVAWLAALEPHLAEDEHHSHQSAYHAYRASLVIAKMKQMLASNDVPQCHTIHGVIWEVEQLERHVMTYIARTAAGNPICLTTVSRHNYYRGFRMKLRSSLWELLNNAKHSPEPQLDSLIHETQSKICVDLISKLSDEVLETIPIVLDFRPSRTAAAPGRGGFSYSRPQKWHDALSLLWPLRLVAWFTLSLEDQKSAARDGLRRIASEFHIMHALNP